MGIEAVIIEINDVLVCWARTKWPSDRSGEQTSERADAATASGCSSSS